MSLPDIKALKKIADACRKAGIKHFRSNDFEFTLSDDAPVKRARRAKGGAPQIKASHLDDGKVETSEPSSEELLFWSSNPSGTLESDNEQ